MTHFQPQAAGLPSGSFGARRGASTAPRPLRRVLAAPHRLAFTAGGVLLAASALWWALALLAPVLGVQLPWVVAPALAQAWLLGVAVWPLFLVGLLCEALPRWLGSQPLSAQVVVVPAGLLAAGGTVAALGFHVSGPLGALGLAAVAVGLALLAGLVGLMLLEHRSAGGDAAARAPALPALAGLAVLAVATWAGAVALALGQAAWLQMSLQMALWLGLVPLAVALARRDGAGMAPAGTRQGALQRFAWVWLGTAAGLTVLRPDLPAWPALLMGSLGSLVLVRATEVALQQAGQRPRIDNTVWFSAWAAQAAVLATLLAPLLADGGPALALLAAQFWLAAVAHWAWHLQPSLLRLPARPR